MTTTTTTAATAIAQVRLAAESGNSAEGGSSAGGPQGSSLSAEAKHRAAQRAEPAHRTVRGLKRASGKKRKEKKRILVF